MGVFNYKDIYCEMKQLIRHILREHTREIGEIRKKTTTPEFIEKAKSVHGNKYDYSSVEYKSATEPVEIICPKHGSFFQSPSHHNRGTGCPKCSGKGLKNDEWIERFKEIHGHKYNYSKVKYVNAHTNVEIICPIHGSFFQNPSNHLKGQGCSKCAHEKLGASQRSNNEDFIEKSKKIHGNKYDYSKVNYSTNSVPVTIICPTHGEFKQSPQSHLGGSGCPTCAGTIKMNTEDFITKAKKIHGDKYDYALVNYKNTKTPVRIKCPIHGVFKQAPAQHLQGQSCPKCSGNLQSNTNEFIKKAIDIHGKKYDYSLVDYNNAKEKVKIICSIHGVFEQRPNNHLRGVGCPFCQESKGENFVSNLLDLNKIKYVKQHTFIDCTNRIKTSGCRKLPFDFFLPKLNCCIEYDGKQHFENILGWGEEGKLERTQRNDKLKTQYCKKNGIKLIRIPYTMKKEEIEPYILKELGIK